jgi:hypothetical protein
VTGTVVAVALFVGSALAVHADNRRHAADPGARTVGVLRATTLAVLVGVLGGVAAFLGGLSPFGLPAAPGALAAAWVGGCGLAAVAGNALLLRR